MIKRTVPKKITAFFMTVLMAANTVHTVNASVAMGQISSEANVHNIGFTTVTEAEPTPDASFETETAKPIILDCSGKLPFQYNGVLVDIKDSTLEGTYEFVKAPDGTRSMKITYSENEEKFSPYRLMFALQKDFRNEANKYMRVTYMTESELAGSITIVNNASRGDSKVTLVNNTKASGGKWICSEPVNIGASSVLTRFVSGSHNTLEFACDAPDSAIYIKEIAFFSSEKQAYEYYGEPVPENILTPRVSMTFGDGGTAYVLSGDDWGVNKINSDDKTLEITYAAKTNHNINYMAKAGFNASEKAKLTTDYRYVRVYYAAQNPDGCVGVDLYMTNDKNGERILLSENIENTNGEFVLSGTVFMPMVTAERIMGDGTGNPMHVSISTNAALEGGKYIIKGMYFFKTRADADAFTFTEDVGTKVTVNGNDISKYRIIVPEGTLSTKTAADALASHIKALTGVTLPIYDDTSVESEYEILIGVSDRDDSDAGLEEVGGDDSWNRYSICTKGNKIVITAVNPYAVIDGVEAFLTTWLCKGMAVIPEVIEIKDVNHSGGSRYITKYGKWDEITNVQAPDSFFEDFDTDDGYFTESDNADVWKIKDGVYSANAGDERADSYIQAFDANVTLGSKIRYSAVTANGDVGLLLRYTARDSYLRAGYDFEKGEWYIEYREGNDFATVRCASKAATLTADTWYELEFTADGDKATLSVDGKEILTASGIAQVTPGKPGMFAKNAAVSVDDINILFMSGMATVMRNVSYTRLPDELFREGGSVMEQSDGTLIFRSQHSNANFKSTDGGITWVKNDEAVFGSNGYPGFLRLTDGTWITTDRKTVNGSQYMISKTSTDDGKTWTDGGIITAAVYPTDGKGGSVAKAVNMNDKITEMATTGRIFYSQNYEVADRSKPNDGKIVFCEFFYSDDKGKTWTKSDTASWEIEGNESEAWFGECKILECADGTLRMYNSWNDYGCIVYSESNDGGVTWGPIVRIPEFVCAKSSMQFCSDPYAENDTTYYLVWVNSEQEEGTSGASSTMTRARLSLAKSTDGKNWSYIGDLWHWRCDYRYGNIMAHIVDPFVTATKDAIIVGTGLAEYLPVTGDNSNGHGAQREHIWTISRDTADETAKPMNKFTDIDMGAPYYEAVTFVTENGLFNGTSETTFAPETVMNRAMFVTVLGRLSKADVSTYTKPTFKDVKAGEWYTSYVEWAAANDIVNGMGSGIYGVDGTITVGQACTILYRFNGGKNGDTSDVKLSDFADSADISAWATDGVKWAVENGIYSGMNGKLEPNSPVSRAVVATMFANYVKYFG